MNNSITTSLLKELGNHGMAEEFSNIIALPIQRRPTLEASVAKMAEAEQIFRKKAKAENPCRRDADTEEKSTTSPIQYAVMAFNP